MIDRRSAVTIENMNHEELVNLKNLTIQKRTNFLDQLHNNIERVERAQAEYKEINEAYKRSMSALVQSPLVLIASVLTPQTDLFQKIKDANNSWESEDRRLKKEYSEATARTEELTLLKPDILSRLDTDLTSIQARLNSLLFSSIKESDAKQVKSLLENKINPNVKMNIAGYSQVTPLIMCTLWNYNEKIMALLLDHGADVNEVDSQQNTALHTAAHFFSSNHCLFLLANKANPALKNKHGQTPGAILEKEHNKNPDPSHSKAYSFIRKRLL